MSCDPDTRNALAHAHRQEKKRARKTPLVPVHPLFGTPIFVTRHRPPDTGRYARCPQCGNPTRGTARANDDRCAKCQQALPQIAIARARENGS